MGGIPGYGTQGGMVGVYPGMVHREAGRHVPGYTSGWVGRHVPGYTSGCITVGISRVGIPQGV